MKKLNGTIFKAFWARHFGTPVNFYSFGDPDIQQIEFIDSIEGFIEACKFRDNPKADCKITFAVPKANRDLNLVIEFLPRVNTKLDLTTTECADAAWDFTSEYFVHVQKQFLEGDSTRRCSTVRKFYEVTGLNLLDYIDPLDWGDVPYKYCYMADSSRQVTRVGDL